MTDALFTLLLPDALYDRGIAERHRLIFYRGHFEAFDWNLLGGRLLELPSFDAGFDQLFAFGIDPIDGQLPSDQPSDWPSRDRVETYVERMRAELDRALRRPGAMEREVEGVPAWFLLEVALEHRLMHAETFAYLLHELPQARKIAPRTRAGSFRTTEADSPRMVAIPSGDAALGQPRTPDAFGWDNEFEASTVSVPEFAIENINVSNGQYLEFVRAGGYNEPSFWRAEDWAWVQRRGIQHPNFWSARRDGGWDYRGMFTNRPLPAEWPVYVSYAEASAYARFRQRRLPSEAEWHRAALGGRSAPATYPWGETAPRAAHGNFDFVSWDPAPVGAYPEGASAYGVLDLVGNGWEWTSSPFAPLPGFQPFSFYPGYSANFFDGQHYVLKGGSPRTAACMLRGSFRNWFQPHYPYLYASFRCVQAGVL